VARTRSLARAPLYLILVGLVLTGTIHLNTSLRTIREREIDTSLGIYSERISNRQNLIVLGRMEILLARLSAQSAPKEELILEARLQNLMSEENKNSSPEEAFWPPAIFLINALRAGLGKEALKENEETRGLREVERAYILERVRRYKDSEAIYLEVLKSDLDPQLYPPVLLHLALCRVMQGRLQEADSNLNEIIQSYPETEESETAEKMRDAVSGILLERERELTGTSSEKARALLQRLQPEQAKELALSIISSNASEKDKASALLILGEISESEGNADSAADYYEQSLSMGGTQETQLELKRKLIFLSHFFLNDASRVREYESDLIRAGDPDFVRKIAALDESSQDFIPQAREATYEPRNWLILRSKPGPSQVFSGNLSLGYTPMTLVFETDNPRLLTLVFANNTAELELSSSTGTSFTHFWNLASIPAPDRIPDSESQDVSAIIQMPRINSALREAQSYLIKGYWVRPQWESLFKVAINNAETREETLEISRLQALAQARLEEEERLRKRQEILDKNFSELPEVKLDESKSSLGWTGVGAGAILLTGMGVSIWAGNQVYSDYLGRVDDSAADLRLTLITLSAVSWTTAILGGASLAGGGTFLYQDFTERDILHQRGVILQELDLIEEELRIREPVH